MNICLVSTVFPPAMGGPSIQTYHIALALTRAGHHVTIITPRHPERHASFVESLPQIKLIEAGRINNTLISKVGWKLEVALAVHRELRTNHYDILHCQNGPGLAGLLVGIAARVNGVPSFTKFPADEVLHRVNTYKRISLDPVKYYTINWKTRFWTIAQTLALRTFTIVWTVHSFDYDNLISLFGFSTDRVCLLPNFQHFDLFDRNHTNDNSSLPVIVCACRLVAIKGVDLLIKSYAQVPEKIRGELWLLGEGVPRVVQELEQLVDDLQLKGQVKFLGRVSPLEMPKYLRQASVYLNTLTNRYFGAGFVEALAAGNCIVAMNLGSWPEIVDFEKIPALIGKDIDETSKLLEETLRNPDLRQKYALRGQEFVKQLSLDTHLDVLLQTYQKAIEIFVHTF